MDQQKEEQLSRDIVQLVIKEEKELTAISRIFINGLLMVINTAYQGKTIPAEERTKFLQALNSGFAQAVNAMIEREVSAATTPDKTI